MSDKKESNTLSADFDKKVADAKKLKMTIAKQKAEVEESLNGKRKHREVIKANDGNPDQDIRNLDSKKKELDRQAQVVKSEIDNLHLEERTQLLAAKANHWKKNYQQIVEPRERRVQNAEAQLEAVFSEYTAAVVGDQPEDFELAAEAERIDARIDVFIESGIECGVPSNYRLTESDKVGKAVAGSAEEDVRKFQQKVNKLMEKFRKDVEAARKKNNPAQDKLLTEGQRPSNWRQPRP